MNQEELNLLEADKALEEMETLRRHYNGGELPDRLQQRVLSVLEAQTPQEASKLRKRVVSATLFHYLALWAKGAITGPFSEERCKRLAHEARCKAQYYISQGREDLAQKQSKRAEVYEAMEANPGSVSPEQLEAVKRKRRSTKSIVQDEVSLKVLAFIKDSEEPVSRVDIFNHFQDKEKDLPKIWSQIIRSLKQERMVLQQGAKKGAKYTITKKGAETC